MILFFNYARSGGTLLNRALANDDQIIIISEVNKLGSGASRDLPAMKKGGIKKQLSTWYDIKTNSHDFSSEIESLHEIQAITNKNVIVRDWTFIDFSPHFLNDYKPSYQLSISRVKPDTVFALIRNPLDVWLSRNEPLGVFFKSYHKYIQSLKDNKVKCFEYESMVSDPSIFFAELYSYMGINNKLSYERFFNSKNASGDLQKRNKMNEMKEFVNTSNKAVSKRKKKEFIQFIKNNTRYSFVVASYLENILQRPAYDESLLNYVSSKIITYVKFPIRTALEDFRWRINSET